MAKRRRLTPANPDYLGPPEGAAPETKSIFPSYPNGVAPTRDRPRPPVADVAGSASAHAALGELAQTLEKARAEGRMVVDLPLEAVRPDYLVRDRVVFDEDEMQALVESLRARGQQTQVEVADLGDGSYGLISGWRRCRALKRLAEETGEARFGKVLALIRRPEVSAEAYVAMVEENEIRVGLSYYERARIAVKAAESGVFETEQKALRGLFAAASRAKRSKIGSFTGIVRALDGSLRFPEGLGERAGLALAKALEADPALAGRIVAALERAAPENAEAEQALIQGILAPAPVTKPKPEAPAPAPEAGPGIRLAALETGKGGGRIRLEGPGVDAALHAALQDWLKTRE